jgi:hypothetical protein
VDVDSAFLSAVSVLDASSTKTGFASVFFSAVFSVGLESLETTFEPDSVAFTAGFSMDSAFFSASLFGSYRVMSPLISGFFKVYRKKCKRYQKYKSSQK